MPNPSPHKLHRRHVGPLTQAPFPAAAPQYQTGPRHGQQLALLRRVLVTAWLSSACAASAPATATATAEQDVAGSCWLAPRCHPEECDWFTGCFHSASADFACWQDCDFPDQGADCPSITQAELNTCDSRCHGIGSCVQDCMVSITHICFAAPEP